MTVEKRRTILENPGDTAPFRTIIILCKEKKNKVAGKILTRQYSNSILLFKPICMGPFRIRLDVLRADCMPRMIVCLVNHRSNQ